MGADDIRQIDKVVFDVGAMPWKLACPTEWIPVLSQIAKHDFLVGDAQGDLDSEITVVGEQGPEIAMMPPGTQILPLGRATKQDIKAAQSTGRAYQAGGTINFGELPFGLRQLQAGRPITPSRGYLSQAAGLTLPSAQALSNITPESRDVFFDLAAQAGIPSRAFGQELQTAIPRGTRLPTSRMLPLGRRGVR